MMATKPGDAVQRLRKEINETVRQQATDTLTKNFPVKIYWLLSESLSCII